MDHRILISGYDHSANSEVARSLAKDNRALVTAEHEFQKCLDTGDKYRWLSLLVDMEQHYHQSVIILWFSNNDRKKIRIQNPDNKRLLSYCNDILFKPYSNKALNNIRTRIYFLNISERVRLSDTAELIRNYLGSEIIPTFEANTEFSWTFPFGLLELVSN